MATFISTDEGDLLNLDHIQVIARTAVDSSGEQSLIAKTCGGPSSHVLFKGTPDELEQFRGRLGVLIGHGGQVIDTAKEAAAISRARMAEQERTAAHPSPVLDDDFFKPGEL